MTDQEYPLDKALFGPNDKAMAQSWVLSLNLIGAENVRSRLAQNGHLGPGAAIPIGMVQAMSIGFAEQWLAWQDQQKSQREATFHRSQIYWTRFAAIAAAVAAIAAIVGVVWAMAAAH